MSTILTITVVKKLIRDTVAAKIIQGEDIEPKDWVDFARAIEQAVLQSEQVQAWKEKAAMIDLLEQHHGADISILSGGEWEVCGSDIYGIGASLAEAFDAAMEEE